MEKNMETCILRARAYRVGMEKKMETIIVSYSAGM